MGKQDDIFVTVEGKPVSAQPGGEDDLIEGGQARPRSVLFRVNMGLGFGIALMLVSGVGYRYFPVVQKYLNSYDRALSSEALARSVELVRNTADIQQVIGTESALKADRETAYNITFLGMEDTAHIVLVATGNLGMTRVVVDWEKFSGSWRMEQASFVNAEGETLEIPLRSDGSRMPSEDIALYREADPDTPLGAAKRSVLKGQAMAGLRKFDETLKKDPKNVEALFWKGRAFEDLGNALKARDNYEKALKVNPEYAPAKERLAKIGG